MPKEKKTLRSSTLYVVGWICALPIERAAARALLEEEHNEPEGFRQHQSDTNSYLWGRIAKQNIVIASLSAGVYGTTSAATTALELISSLPHIRIGLLVGIGGGIPRPDDNDIRLGDVIVSQPDGITGGVVQYDFGKATSKSNGVWERKGSLNKPPPVLLNALVSLKADHEIDESRVPSLLESMIEANPGMRRAKSNYAYPGVENDHLFQSSYAHIGGKTCDKCDISYLVEREQRDSNNPEFHYGIIASGNTLIKDAITRDVLSDKAGEEFLCVEMEAAGLMDRFPCLVIRGVCDYADSHKNDTWQRYAAATAAAFAAELLGHVPARQLEETQQVGEILHSLEQKVDCLTTGIQTVHYTVSLNQLPNAEGASFDSHAEEHNGLCLPNTRVQLLRDIDNWIDSPESKTIFWLNGMAGTGKSTVSRTVAHSRSQKGDLVTSFFFKRGEASRGNMSKLFPSLVHQLTANIPEMGSLIRKVLDITPDIASKALEEQYKRLIQEPLLEIANTKSQLPSLVLIIDALDECEGDGDIKRLPGLLSATQITDPFHLRVLITSRPELPVRLGFLHTSDEYHNMVLHQIPSPIIEHDLSTFFRHELSNIRDDYNRLAGEHQNLPLDWPGEAITQKLITEAMPLFIAAVTICRFLNDSVLGSPDELLQRVLESTRNHYASKFAMTYSPVLEQQLINKSKRERQEIIEGFRLIVGSIILLESPLSPRGLAMLLDSSVSKVTTRLRLLHSVLDVPAKTEAPVRTLHLSFQDYLLDVDQREENQFWVDENATQYNLARHCLRVLSNNLHEDMCDLASLKSPLSKIDESRLKECLSEEVQYACRNWVYHWAALEVDAGDVQVIDGFLRTHVLHWIEAMSCMDRTSESGEMIRRLMNMLTTEEFSEFRMFLQYLLAFNSRLHESPATTYSDASSHYPSRRIVRQSFMEDIAAGNPVQPDVQDDQYACMLIMEGHEDRVTHVVVSPDSRLVASTSDDYTMRVWSTQTADCKWILEGDGGVTFSDDSKLVAAGHSTLTTRIWSTQTGKLLRTFEGSRSVAFSPNCEMAACGGVWDIETGNCIVTQEDVGYDLEDIVFSHDSQQVAVACGNAIRVWNTRAGKCESRLEGHNDCIYSVDFSHDSKMIVSASQDGTARIWNTRTGACEHILKGHHGTVVSAKFSHDSKLVASASSDDSVRIWNTQTGECVVVFKGHKSCVKSVAFSHDSKLVVSASMDDTARVWNVETRKCVQVLQGHIDVVNSAVFLPNSTSVATASDDGRIRVWKLQSKSGAPSQHAEPGSSELESIPHPTRVTVTWNDAPRIWFKHTGNPNLVLNGYGGLMVFSHNSKMAAWVNKEHMVRVWELSTGKAIVASQLQPHPHTQEVSFTPDDSGLATNIGIISLAGREIPIFDPPELLEDFIHSDKSPYLDVPQGKWFKPVIRGLP